MLKGIVGQPGTVALLEQIAARRDNGRTLLFSGGDGAGKFTAAVEFAREIFGSEPFVNPDFFVYRNDDFELKTRFFLSEGRFEADPEAFRRYFFYLQSRLSSALFLNETTSKESANRYQGLRADLETLLLAPKPAFAPFAGMESDLVQASQELSLKRQMSINVVRSLIEFNSQRPSGSFRVSILGNFENATEEAQNAALKLFEEPPATSFVLITTGNLQRILPTIRSRSLKFEFDPLSPASAQKIFGTAQAAGGSTLETMRETVYHYGDFKRDIVSKFFDKVSPEIGSGIALFQFVDEVTAAGGMDSCGALLEGLMETIENVMLLRQSAGRACHAGEGGQRNERLARGTDTGELKRLRSETQSALQGIRFGNWNPKAVLPALLLEYSRWNVRSK